MQPLKVRLRKRRGRGWEYQEIEIPADHDMERVASELHATRQPVLTSCLGWKVFYSPSYRLSYSTTQIDLFTGERGPTVEHPSSTISTCAFGQDSNVWRVCYSWNRGDNEPPVRIQEKGDVVLVTGLTEGNLFHQGAQTAAEYSSNEHLFEGAIQWVQVDDYERNPEARTRCIEHYGAKCFVCGFDFGGTYGHVATGFIHVHHLTPLSETCAVHAVDPVRDMRPVCPNCHAVLHMRTPPFGIEEVQAFLSSGAPKFD